MKISVVKLRSSRLSAVLNAALDDPRGTRTETTVLFLAANPAENPLLQLGEECRAIEDKIRAAKFREKLRFRSRWAARPDDLLQALHEDDPAVLHFSGHGAGAQGLCFLAEDGGVFCVNSDGLGQVIRAAGDSIQLVVLNACYTKVQAEALVAHVPCVIGMPSAIGDKSAVVYAAELYRALAFGKSVASAHQCGLAALALHSMVGNMRDIDVAEAVLRTAPPELLVRTGVDAGYVHIVQGALPTSAVPASSAESRIHLEIDIDADFETLDASTLSKLVSEICRLSGGRPVRILCVTKGSIRLHLSFEPDAARSLMSLRDSGRLNRIGGFRVSNIVDLGQVENFPQAHEHVAVPQPLSGPAIEVVRIEPPRPGQEAYGIADISSAVGPWRGADSPDLVPSLPDLVPALTIVSHPVTHRVGERCLLDRVAAGGEVSLSRNAPDFSRPDRVVGQALGDPFVSRKPIRFAPGPDGGVRVIVEASGTRVIAGVLVDGSAEFTADELARGVPLELAERVVLLLHLVDRRVEDASDPLGMVGASTGIRRVRTAIERVIDLDVPVLIRGETGTGKELVARVIHSRSPRPDGPFVSVNLGAVPHELAAAELFGSTRGAHSGTSRDRDGLFRVAHGGTLFLDEVGEAPPEVQVMLLRALETREIYPVGADRPVAIEVRLITATDANLEERIQHGLFRASLLDRLAGFEIQLPPLRERREDIGLLVYHFAREELAALGEDHRLSPQDPYARPWLPAHVAAQLVRYAWPRNIRELRNVMRQLVIESRGLPQLEIDPRLADQLGIVARPEDSKSLGPRARGSDPGELTLDSAIDVSRSPSDPAIEVRRKASEVTEAELQDALRACAWDLKAAADRLRIPRPSIYDLIERSPDIRTAGDLGADEIAQCFQACAGDLDAMVAQLQVSRRALSRRLRELGLAGRSSASKRAEK
jgi:two-component system nitrogen regulation response regulator GlnG